MEQLQLSTVRGTNEKQQYTYYSKKHSLSDTLSLREAVLKIFTFLADMTAKDGGGGKTLVS